MSPRFNIYLLAALLGVTAFSFRESSTDPTSNESVSRSTDPDSLSRMGTLDVLDPDDCLACHDDDSFTMKRDGETVSIYVDPDLYEESPHNELDCIACHIGYDPDEEPHVENPGPVNCASCHDDASADHALSGHEGEIGCSSCHTDVHTPSGVVAVEATCQNCHDDAVSELALSAHAGNHVAPTCLTCHSAHRFELAQTATCLSCHGEREFVHDHVVHEDLEAILSYEQSIHGDLIECSDCHAGHLVLPPDDPRSAISRMNISATCAECHSDEAALYETSEHGKALASGFEMAPACTDCHGEHDIHQISDAASPMSRSHEVEVCLGCHLDSPDVQARMTHSTGFIAGFEKSVHGQASAGGNGEAAICSDCHGAHEAMKTMNPDAGINKFNLSATCGQCHEEEHTVFDESIHGVALAKGIQDAPTCTTCHSEHDILATKGGDSPVGVTRVSEEVCVPCHESAELSDKYGFPSDRTATFSDSYHGLAGRSGSTESANCSSCHGIHNIWPSSDPRSLVHADNLQETCGSCHPGANANFTKGSVHIDRTAGSNSMLYWIGTVYFWVIVVTIGSMLVHNTLDWGRKTIVRYRQSLEEVPLPTAAVPKKLRFYERMTLTERIQHATLAASFSLLALTGFMLKYPEAWWVVGLRDLVGEGFFNLRGLLHRIAAVVMVVDGVWHLYTLVLTKHGRRVLKDIWFSRKDFSDLVHMIKYYLGRRKDRPRFDRFNYVEKSEYWALLWGTVVMTLTGFALWFENYFMSEHSKLFVDVNETIHYYEAWLAFLAIVVWHFYYVIFNPDVYPMNFTWITGKMSEKEMEHEHPIELERLKAEEAEATEATEATGD
ncbi:cytochrome b/b6 domain-containing protein [Bacteroidota bacterium]